MERKGQKPQKSKDTIVSLQRVTLDPSSTTIVNKSTVVQPASSTHATSPWKTFAWSTDELKTFVVI